MGLVVVMVSDGSVGDVGDGVCCGSGCGFVGVGGVCVGVCGGNGGG